MLKHHSEYHSSSFIGRFPFMFSFYLGMPFFSFSLLPFRCAKCSTSTPTLCAFALPCTSCTSARRGALPSARRPTRTRAETPMSGTGPPPIRGGGTAGADPMTTGPNGPCCRSRPPATSPSRFSSASFGRTPGTGGACVVRLCPCSSCVRAVASKKTVVFGRCVVLGTNLLRVIQRGKAGSTLNLLIFFYFIPFFLFVNSKVASHFPPLRWAITDPDYRSPLRASCGALQQEVLARRITFLMNENFLPGGAKSGASGVGTTERGGARSSTSSSIYTSSSGSSGAVGGFSSSSGGSAITSTGGGVQGGRILGGHLCPSFMNVVLLRKPIERLISHRKYLIDYLHAPLPRHDWRSFVELAPIISNDYFCRVLGGEATYRLPLGNLTNGHLEAAFDVLRTFDLVSG